MLDNVANVVQPRLLSLFSRAGSRRVSCLGLRRSNLSLSPRAFTMTTAPRKSYTKEWNCVRSRILGVFEAPADRGICSLLIYPRLNLFFTIASITANVSALPVGTILDRHGSRICGLIGCVLLAIGSLFMAFSFLRPEFHGFIAGNFFLALGGTCIFVPSFQIANAFPRRAGTIVALVTGAFDASAAVFLFYALAYERSNRTFTPDKFFLGYLIVPAVIFIAQLTFMPKRDYHSTLQLESKMERAEDATRDVHQSDDEIESQRELERVRSERADRRKNTIDQINKILGDKDVRQQRAEREEDRHQAAQVWGALHGMEAHKQMATPWFILITLMTVLQMLRMNYFIATIGTQYEYMLGSDEQAERINQFFDVALPLGGVLSTPVIGFLLDRFSVPAMLAFIVVLTTTIGVLNSIPAIWAGYMTVVLFVLLRPLYYSAMRYVPRSLNRRD